MSRYASPCCVLVGCLLISTAGCGGSDAPGGEALAAHASPVEGSERLVDKTFDDIKFDIEPDAPYDSSMLTDAIRELDGRRIRLRGYILPTAQKRGIEQFVLVRDNQECCFGPGAALYDCVLVEMLPGGATEYTIRLVSVEGVFTLSEFPGPDGRPLAIYHIAGESVD